MAGSTLIENYSSSVSCSQDLTMRALSLGKAVEQAEGKNAVYARVVVCFCVAKAGRNGCCSERPWAMGDCDKGWFLGTKFCCKSQKSLRP